MKNKKDRKIDFKYNLKEYWSLLKRHKGTFFGLMILALVIEILFTVDKFLFKRIIDDGEKFLSGILPQDVFVNALGIIGLIFGGVVILRTVGKWIMIHVANILDCQLLKDIKTRYFNYIVDLSHNFHTTHKTGSLISRMHRGSGAIEGITDIFIYQAAPLIFQLIIVGVSLAYFSLMTSLVVLGIAISFISYSFFIQRKQQVSKLVYNSLQDIEKGFISDVFTNIDSIKYFGKEQNIKSRFNKITDKTRLSLLRYEGYYRWFDAGQILILGVGTFLLIYFPLMQFLAKEITLGTLVFIYTIYGNLVGPMFGFVWGVRGFYRYMADFQDLFEYGKVENEIKDMPGAKDLSIGKGTIDFNNVSFSYGKKRAFSLDKFTLKIKEGEKIALVGHSGCGKTTLIKLLYRLYDVDDGEILIDRKNIKKVRQESLREEMSIVPQECILFDDTIYNNIKFANPQASREKVIEAIKFAQLGKVIKGFPNGLNTIVGERGVKLSGGEKQRVSIARAILANKKILILDEATSALDSRTENEIQAALRKLLEGKTSIMIAHRLSTIMNADRIIVMKDGKIIQQGKHRDLVKRAGEYKKLWNLQKGGYIK